MTTPTSARPFANRRILLAHSNDGTLMADWHERRRQAASALGYDLSVFAMTKYHPYAVFPKVDRLWRKRDPRLMRLYDALGPAIDACDVFIHYNGALIHPDFLSQFDKRLTVYHCADDPDASNTLSRDVAPAYDVCAPSNAAELDRYRKWGCRNVFFWPIGSFSYRDDEGAASVDPGATQRDIPLIFIGSKHGVTNIRYIGKYLGKYFGLFYVRTGRMRKIERAFPQLVGYGAGWDRGWAADDAIPALYRRSRVGVNIHVSTGPVNGRVYDLAAFGVCQICDNKRTLDAVFEEGREIIGFESTKECIELIRYYLAHPDAAAAIGEAGRARFLRDYTMTAIWEGFFRSLASVAPTRA